MSGEREKEDDIVTHEKKKEKQRNSKEKYARAIFLKIKSFSRRFFLVGELERRRQRI